LISISWLSGATGATNSMFGTLHYNASSNETQFVQRSVGGAEQGGNAMAHFACDSCRAKKVEPNALWSQNLPLTTMLCHLSLDATARNTAVSGARLPPLFARTPNTAAKRRCSGITMPIDGQGLGEELLARMKHRLISKSCLAAYRVQNFALGVGRRHLTRCATIRHLDMRKLQ